jgi:hypothetical protein
MGNCYRPRSRPAAGRAPAQERCGCKYPWNGGPAESDTQGRACQPISADTVAIFRHQDSNGGGGLITDGDTQWMTAGARIVIVVEVSRR